MKASEYIEGAGIRVGVDTPHNHDPPRSIALGMVNDLKKLESEMNGLISHSFDAWPFN